MGTFALFVDAGHGSLTPNSGRYLTPGKRAYHEGKNLHKGGWFFEGVSNRIYAEEFIALCQEQGIKVFKTYHPFLDTPLPERVKMVNSYSKSFDKALLMSFHSNAMNGRARGFSVWTTKGKTNSDSVATNLIGNYKTLLPGAKVLEDWRDRDPDFESDFYIIKNSKIPAILLEYLFFDNPIDVDIIVHDKEAKSRYLQACLKTVLWYRG